MPRELTREETICMIQYSWDEWKDLERNTGWPDMRRWLEANEPHILRAYEDYRHHRKVIDLLIGSLGEG